jgi:hypothetical protein
LFVAAGGFHGRQLDLMRLTEGPQRMDAICRVGKLGERAFTANARV